MSKTPTSIDVIVIYLTYTYLTHTFLTYTYMDPCVKTDFIPVSIAHHLSGFCRT